MSRQQIALNDFPPFLRERLWEQSDRSEIGPCVPVESWPTSEPSSDNNA